MSSSRIKILRFVITDGSVWNHQHQGGVPPPGYYYDGYNMPPAYPHQQHPPPHGGGGQPHLPHEIAYGNQRSGWHQHHQVTQKCTLVYDKNENNHEANAGSSKDYKTSSESGRNSLGLELPLESTSNEPVSRTPQPEFWCSITYHELDTPVGETFKAPSKGVPFVQVDGYLDKRDKTRFCLGALSTVQSKPCSETVSKVKHQIGKGILLELVGKS